MNIKYAIFDMDGTLVNSLSFWEDKWRDIGEKYLGVNNYYAPAEVDKGVRTKKLVECATFINESLKLNVSDEEIYESLADGLWKHYNEKATVKNGAEEMLSYLKKNNVKLCLATATESGLARKVMDIFGLTHYFDIIVSCADSDVNIGKESPKVYEKALKLFGADVSETVIFEDSDVALSTAKGLGLMTVGIDDRYNFNTDKVKQYADIYIAQGESIYEGFIKQNKVKLG